MSFAHDHMKVLLQSDLVKSVEDWQQHLLYQRKLSQHTAESYAHDLTSFFRFLATSKLNKIRIEDLQALTLQDLRAYLASKRREELSNTSLSRHFAGLKSYIRFLAQNYGFENDCFERVKAPKVSKSLPKSVSTETIEKILRFITSEQKPLPCARSAPFPKLARPSVCYKTQVV